MAFYISRPDSLLDVFQLRYFLYTLRSTNSCAPSTHKKNDILNKIYENKKEIFELLLLHFFIFKCLCYAGHFHSFAPLKPHFHSSPY